MESYSCKVYSTKVTVDNFMLQLLCSIRKNKKKKNKEVSNSVANEKIISVPKKPVVSNFASFIYYVSGGEGWEGGEGRSFEFKKRKRTKN